MLYESKMNFIMKGFFKYIAAAMAMSLLAIGCTPEILTPDQNQLPEASALEVVIYIVFIFVGRFLFFNEIGLAKILYGF